MSITQKDIAKLSKLAKININDKDKELVIKKLDGILELINAMQMVDTKSIEPMSHALDISQPLREDTQTEFSNKDRYLELGPDSNEDYFIVPRVIE
jgi:aspartyl-tRNA(Asn)/glutamyl-tRNA(Gln) amidotransferase subunit C